MFTKVLVLGSRGMLGQYVAKYLSKKNVVFAYARKDLDATNINKNYILKKINKCQPNVVVNCIGLIKQRNVDNVDMIKVNAVFPLKLADICTELNIPLIHISTDCVFDGKKGNYVETDLHSPISLYDKTKSLGESNKCTIIRTSIIGEEPNGRKLSLLEWTKSKENQKCNGYVNHIWNGITCLQLAKVIDKIINEKIYWHGVRHVFSEEKVCKYVLLQMINKIYELNIDIDTVFDSENYNRTLFSIYETCKSFDIPSLENQIKEQKGFL